jgi:hypothetical protein
MTLGPIEVVEIGFPENRFDGSILAELERLVEQEIITVVDGLFVQKDDDGAITILEFEELTDDDAGRLTELLDEIDSLVSADDVDELAAGLEPGTAAAILVFEHTWVKGFRDAIVDAGGFLAADFRIPGLVVEQLLDELQAVD